MRDGALVEHSGVRSVLRLSADISAAFVGSNAVAASAVPALIREIHQALTSLGSETSAPAERAKPAVPIGRSVREDYIVCLEDGKRLKMLKRYLRARYGMTADDYRRKWALPPEYPMVAPSYAARRSEFAKKIGLGRVGKRTA